MCNRDQLLVKIPRATEEQGSPKRIGKRCLNPLLLLGSNAVEEGQSQCAARDGFRQ
jgi:hypothetical protein